MHAKPARPESMVFGAPRCATVRMEESATRTQVNAGVSQDSQALFAKSEMAALLQLISKVS